ESRRPYSDLVVGVALALAQARVRERRRRAERVDGRRRLLPFRVHERDARRSEQLVHVVDVPRRVAHLERATHVARQGPEESREPVVVPPEPRRRLEQDRAEAVPERSRAVEEDRERLRWIAELANVGDVLRGFEREEKLWRSRLAPVGDVLLGRQVVE